MALLDTFFEMKVNELKEMVPGDGAVIVIDEIAAQHLDGILTILLRNTALNLNPREKESLREVVRQLRNQ